MNWIAYFLQANLFLVVFYGFYWLLLRNETFNTNNRIYLVFSAFLSFAIPFWNSELVQSWIITQEASQIIYSYEISELIINSRPEETTSVDMTQILMIIYGAGVFVFMVRFMINVFRLNQLIQSDEPAVKAFSFFNKVFVDQELKGSDTIYEHEQVHKKQVHSFDVIFFEIIGIICWLNPVVYLYKISIKNIHEFIADEIASQHVSSKADYALLLFSQQFHAPTQHLANHFYSHSTLKLRIKMLGKERSAKMALLKYGMIVPVFIAMLVLTSATIARSSSPTEGISELIEMPASTFEAIIDNDKTRPVKGRVTDETGEPLPGVSVTFKDKTRGAYTDISGNFIMNDVAINAILVFSFPGHLTTEVNSGNLTELTVKLKKSKKGPEPAGALSPAESSVEIISKPVFTVVEQQPEFPGGMDAMYKYIAENISYPTEARENHKEGRVFLKFIVSSTGTVSNIQILKGVGHGCDEEAVRVVATMPKWNPGVQNGKPVDVYFNMPIHFQLSKSKSVASTTSEATSITGIRLRGKVEGIEVGTARLQTATQPQEGKPLTLRSTAVTDDKNEPVRVRVTGYANQARPAQANGYSMNITTTADDFAKNPPLFIVDGTEKEAFKIKDLNPDDIQSISVIKDAQASVLYGDKGRNGVIIIATKKTKAIQPK